VYSIIPLHSERERERERERRRKKKKVIKSKAEESHHRCIESKIHKEEKEGRNGTHEK
jgi:hypothetical protein